MLKPPSVESPPPAPDVRKKWPAWTKGLLATAGLFTVGLALLYLGFTSWLLPNIQQWITPQSPQAAQQQAKAIIRLSKGAPFKVLQATDILGVKLLRMESTQVPQSFVAVSGLDPQTAQDLFQESPDPKILEAMGNSLLKLQDTQHPRTVTVETLKVLDTGSLTAGPIIMPYRHMAIHFTLSNEEKPRQYEGGIGRYQSEGGHETILISYSKAGQYHADLLKTFLESVDLKN